MIKIFKAFMKEKDPEKVLLEQEFEKERKKVKHCSKCGRTYIRCHNWCPKERGQTLGVKSK